MRKLLLLIIIASLAACSTMPPDIRQLRKSAELATMNPARSNSDRLLDEKRLPAQTLSFFQIQPGMKVLDVFGGGGYYTEILSYLVGPEGGVTLYNNNPWDNFVNQQIEKRLDANRLPNVTALTAEPPDLAAHSEQYDAAIFILGMHDIYYEDLPNNWPAIDIPDFLGEIHRLIKPGGVFGIIDHNALPGTEPARAGLELHRIDPAVIIRDVEAVGFTLEAQSDVLKNPEDNMKGSVFAAEIRWKTDRSVLRFRRH